jgi:hypothetical protein
VNILNWKQSLAFILLLVLAAGCGSEQAPTSATDISPTAGGEVEGTPTGGEVTFGPGEFNLLDPVAGLDQESDYRAALTISFDGTREGQLEQWTRRYEMISTETPAARQLMIEISGAATGNVAQERRIVQVGSMRYEQTETGCTASIAGDTDRWQEPASLLPTVVGAEEAGTETLNGVDVTRYTFDQRALGEEGQGDSTGEMLVDGEGRVMMFVLTTQGDGAFSGEGTEGTLTLDYMLTLGESPSDIAIPAGCPAGLIDAPVMPDAESVKQLPGATLFTTPSDLAETVTFYQEELTAMGWQAVGEPTITDTLATALFMMGDQQLSLFATRTGQETSVRLVLVNIAIP